MKKKFLLAAAFTLLATSAPAHEYDHMMGWGHGMGWGGGIVMLLFWIVVIAAIIYTVRWVVLESRKGGQALSDTPLDVLKKRYARGEISKEEYERIKKDIS